MADARAKTAEILKTDKNALLDDWMSELRRAGVDQRVSEAELKAQANQFLTQIADAAAQNTDVGGEAWKPVRESLEEISRAREMVFVPSDKGIAIATGNKIWWQKDDAWRGTMVSACPSTMRQVRVIAK